MTIPCPTVYIRASWMFSRRRPTRDVLRLLRTGERRRVALLHRLRKADEPVRRACRSRVRPSPLRGPAATRQPRRSASLRPPVRRATQRPVVPADARLRERVTARAAASRSTAGPALLRTLRHARRPARVRRDADAGDARHAGDRRRPSSSARAGSPMRRASLCSARRARSAQPYTLDRGEAVIGRGDADIRFEDDHFMSPLHARLELRDGQLWLRDLGSRNGTLGVHRPADASSPTAI